MSGTYIAALSEPAIYYQIAVREKYGPEAERRSCPKVVEVEWPNALKYLTPDTARQLAQGLLAAAGTADSEEEK